MLDRDKATSTNDTPTTEPILPLSSLVGLQLVSDGVPPPLVPTVYAFWENIINHEKEYSSIRRHRLCCHYSSSCDIGIGLCSFQQGKPCI